MSTALILGITGSVGANITLKLADRGWRIRALHRNPEAAAERFSDLNNIDWRQGDLLQPGNAEGAADGCDVIVHAVNPPGYHHWRELALPMLDRSIAAAKASGATLVFPANVYNYAPDIGHNVSEDAPQQAVTEKGRVRVEMEDRLRQASAEGVRVILVRAGDFFGPGAGSSMLNYLVKPGQPVKRLGYPGPLDVTHAYAYLPDLAETFARLIEQRADLAAYADFQFAGHALSANQLAATLRQVVAEPGMKVGGFPWWLIRLAAPFNPTFKGLLEMRYLWHKPITLNNAKLVATLGEEPHTPLDEALTATLRQLGCLGDAQVKAA